MDIATVFASIMFLTVPNKSLGAFSFDNIENKETICENCCNSCLSDTALLCNYTTDETVTVIEWYKQPGVLIARIFGVNVGASLTVLAPYNAPPYTVTQHQPPKYNAAIHIAGTCATDAGVYSVNVTAASPQSDVIIIKNISCDCCCQEECKNSDTDESSCYYCLLALLLLFLITTIVQLVLLLVIKLKRSVIVGLICFIYHNVLVLPLFGWLSFIPILCNEGKFRMKNLDYSLRDKIMINVSTTVGMVLILILQFVPWSDNCEAGTKFGICMLVPILSCGFAVLIMMLRYFSGCEECGDFEYFCKHKPITSPPRATPNSTYQSSH